jgi:SAM-dependent methyltransferase
MEGWINLDRMALPGVDIVCDLDPGGQPVHIPLEDDSVDEFYASHFLEHISYPLPMMEELWRIAKHDALFTIKVPYGSSDGAWEDPTHVRAYFPESFNYFGQPYYHLADYGYRGDWINPGIDLILPDSPLRFETDLNVVEQTIKRERNRVNEIQAVLRAVKPIRPPDLSLCTKPYVRYLFTITPEPDDSEPPVEAGADALAAFQEQIRQSTL